MILKSFVLLYIIQTTQSYMFMEIPRYRQECINQLNISQDLAPFNILTNSQLHDLQCLDRCILIKRGVINENETLQEDAVKQQFPNIKFDFDLNKTCPIIVNVTDKCEKASLINKCLEHQTKPWANRKRMPPHREFNNFPPGQGRQHRNECMREVAQEIVNSNFTSNLDRRAGRLRNQWCVDRCIMIKTGILNSNNTISRENVISTYRIDQDDIIKCESFKNEDNCKGAADINFCLNRLSRF